MRALAIAVLVVPGVAMADRETYVAIGGLIGARDVSTDAQMAPPELVGGGRVTLSFDRPFVAWPERGATNVSGRLVPELFAGFEAGDIRGEALLGAGLRGEVQAATDNGLHVRVSWYAALRAEVIGDHRDPAGEFVIGEYFPIGSGRVRFGFDGGPGLRHDSATTRNQLAATAHCYVSWRL